MAEPNIKPSNASVQMRRARLVLRGDLTRLAGLEPRTARSCSAASRPPARLAAGAHRAKLPQNVQWNVWGLSNVSRSVSNWQEFASSNGYSSWFEDNSTLCTWNGVVCNASGWVTGVSLACSSCEIPAHGVLPADLSSLPGLSTLTLSGNELGGTLPDLWARVLPRLSALYLEGNEVTGSIPEAWSPGDSFPSLVSLDLSDNSLTGSLPMLLFASLPRLSTVRVSRNGFSGTIPDIWDSSDWAPKLQIIAMDGNQISGSVPWGWSQLNNLTSLAEIYIQNNNLTGGLVLPSYDSNNETTWQGVRIVDISNNPIGGSFPGVSNDVTVLTSLHKLGLSNTSLVGSIPSSWSTDAASLRSIQSLDIRYNDLTGSFPANFFSDRPQLRTVYVKPGNDRFCPDTGGVAKVCERTSDSPPTCYSFIPSDWAVPCTADYNDTHGTVGGLSAGTLAAAVVAPVVFVAAILSGLAIHFVRRRKRSGDAATTLPIVMHDTLGDGSRRSDGDCAATGEGAETRRGGAGTAAAAATAGVAAAAAAGAITTTSSCPQASIFCGSSSSSGVVGGAQPSNGLYRQRGDLSSNDPMPGGGDRSPLPPLPPPPSGAGRGWELREATGVATGRALPPGGLWGAQVCSNERQAGVAAAVATQPGVPSRPRVLDASQGTATALADDVRPGVGGSGVGNGADEASAVAPLLSASAAAASDAAPEAASGGATAVAVAPPGADGASTALPSGPLGVRVRSLVAIRGGYSGVPFSGPASALGGAVECGTAEMSPRLPEGLFRASEIARPGSPYGEALRTLPPPASPSGFTEASMDARLQPNLELNDWWLEEKDIAIARLRNGQPARVGVGGHGTVFRGFCRHVQCVAIKAIGVTESTTGSDAAIADALARYDAWHAKLASLAGIGTAAHVAGHFLVQAPGVQSAVLRALPPYIAHADAGHISNSVSPRCSVPDDKAGDGSGARVETRRALADQGASLVSATSPSLASRSCSPSAKLLADIPASEHLVASDSASDELKPEAEGRAHSAAGDDTVAHRAPTPLGATAASAFGTADPATLNSFGAAATSASATASRSVSAAGIAIPASSSLPASPSGRGVGRSAEPMSLSWRRAISPSAAGSTVLASAVSRGRLETVASDSLTGASPFATSLKQRRRVASSGPTLIDSFSSASPFAAPALTSTPFGPTDTPRDLGWGLVGVHHRRDGSAMSGPRAGSSEPRGTRSGQSLGASTLPSASLSLTAIASPRASASQASIRATLRASASHGSNLSALPAVPSFGPGLATVGVSASQGSDLATMGVSAPQGSDLATMGVSAPQGSDLATMGVSASQGSGPTTVLAFASQGSGASPIGALEASQSVSLSSGAMRSSVSLAFDTAARPHLAASNGSAATAVTTPETAPRECHSGVAPSQASFSLQIARSSPLVTDPETLPSPSTTPEDAAAASGAGVWMRGPFGLVSSARPRGLRPSFEPSLTADSGCPAASIERSGSVLTHMPSRTIQGDADKTDMARALTTGTTTTTSFLGLSLPSALTIAPPIGDTATPSHPSIGDTATPSHPSISTLSNHLFSVATAELDVPGAPLPQAQASPQTQMQMEAANIDVRDSTELPPVQTRPRAGESAARVALPGVFVTTGGERAGTWTPRSLQSSPRDLELFGPPLAHALPAGPGATRSSFGPLGVAATAPNTPMNRSAWRRSAHAAQPRPGGHANVELTAAFAESSSAMQPGGLTATVATPASSLSSTAFDTALSAVSGVGARSRVVDVPLAFHHRLAISGEPATEIRANPAKTLSAFAIEGATADLSSSNAQMPHSACERSVAGSAADATAAAANGDGDRGRDDDDNGADLPSGREESALSPVDAVSTPLASDADFLHEVTLLRACRDVNVVQFVGAVMTPRAHWLITEYCEGGSLAHSLARERVTWRRRGLRVALDVARGMAYLHSRGVVHLDLKPGNVLLTRDGTAKISDVGLASVRSGAASDVSGRVGTLAWAAPETLWGMRCTDKADVFGFGVILWEMVTGQGPVRGNLREPRVPGECSAEAAALIAACLEMDPNDRPSAVEIVQILERMVRHEREEQSRFRLARSTPPPAQ